MDTPYQKDRQSHNIKTLEESFRYYYKTENTITEHTPTNTSHSKTTISTINEYDNLATLQTTPIGEQLYQILLMMLMLQLHIMLQTAKILLVYHHLM